MYLKVNHVIAILCDQVACGDVNAIDGSGYAAIHYLALATCGAAFRYHGERDNQDIEDARSAAMIIAAMHASRCYELDMNVATRPCKDTLRVGGSTPLSLLTWYSSTFDPVRLCMTLGATALPASTDIEEEIAKHVHAGGSLDREWELSYESDDVINITRVEMCIQPRIIMLALLGGRVSGSGRVKLSVDILRRVFVAFVDDSVWGLYR